MGKILSKSIIYIVLIALSLLFLIPTYVIVVTSLKPFSEVSISTMWQLPSTIEFSSYLKAFDVLAPNFFNSVMLVIPATLLSALIGSLNGYVLSKWRFKGSELVFGLLLFGMFIPYQSILIPLIQTLQKAGLYNSMIGLIFTHTVYGIPITTLMFRNLYASIPTVMLEAAKVDGAGFLRIYRDIMVPLSITGFVVVAIWQFTNVWNEFLFGITIASTNTHPITVGLQNLAGSAIVEWNVQMAGAVIAGLPTMLVYVFLGRYFVRGLLAGSVKG